MLQKSYTIHNTQYKSMKVIIISIMLVHRYSFNVQKWFQTHNCVMSLFKNMLDRNWTTNSIEAQNKKIILLVDISMDIESLFKISIIAFNIIEVWIEKTINL